MHTCAWSWGPSDYDIFLFFVFEKKTTVSNTAKEVVSKRASQNSQNLSPDPNKNTTLLLLVQGSFESVFRVLKTRVLFGWLGFLQCINAKVYREGDVMPLQHKSGHIL